MNFILGVVSLATMMLFVGIVLIFWQKALWHVIKAKWQGTSDVTHLQSGSSIKVRLAAHFDCFWLLFGARFFV